MSNRSGDILETSENGTNNSPPTITTSSSDLSALAIESNSTSPASTEPPKTESADYRLSIVDSSDDLISNDECLVATESVLLNQSTKRTVSGTTKRSPRRFSAVELSSELKSKLKYAMIKVQNGWESKSIQQIESMSPQLSESPSFSHSRRQSEASETYSMSPLNLTSQSMSNWKDLPTSKASAALMAVTGSTDVEARQEKRRSLNSRITSTIASSNIARKERNKSSVDWSKSRSPVTPRQTRENLQNQAEKDAIDTLIFMSSPNNSQSVKYLNWNSQEQSQSQSQSRLQRLTRSKKVDFEKVN